MNPTCPNCGNKAMFIGSVGSRSFYACRHCGGTKFTKDVDDYQPESPMDPSELDYEIDDAGKQIYIGGEPPDAKS